MLRAPLRSTIQLYIQYFSKSSRLDGPNQPFCGVCGINQDATSDISLINGPPATLVTPGPPATGGGAQCPPPKQKVE